MAELPELVRILDSVRKLTRKLPNFYEQKDIFGTSLLTAVPVVRLLDLMTGRETLRMFAKLRGVPRHSIETVVENLLGRLTLNPHADKQAGSYSGGNKRKLSLGIAALVGDGGVLLVDECSTGLDPLARRKLWSLIEDLSLNRSVVLTTHSMEEAGRLFP